MPIVAFAAALFLYACIFRVGAGFSVQCIAGSKRVDLARATLIQPT